MLHSFIAGIGMYVPPQVVSNQDLTRYMDTSDEWIQERTGIKERRFADRTGETTATMGIEAAKNGDEKGGSDGRRYRFYTSSTLLIALKRFFSPIHFH